MIGSEPLLKIVCLAQVAQNPMLAEVLFSKLELEPLWECSICHVVA